MGSGMITPKPYRKRETARASLYRTDQWRKLRKLVIARDPVCTWCGIKPSTQADHVTHAPDNARFYDPTIIVGACRSCNMQRAGRERWKQEHELQAQSPKQKRLVEVGRTIDTIFDSLMLKQRRDE